MRIFYSALMLISVLTASAGRIAHVTIYSEDQTKFTVYLNGEKQNEEPLARVRIINLTQPYYKLRIEFADPTLAPIDRKIFQLTNGDGNPVDATHVIKKNKKGEMGLHWQSQSVFPAYIETDKPTVVVVQGGAVQQTQTTKTVESTGQPSGVSMSFGVPGGSVSVNTGGNGAATQQTTTTTTTTAVPVGAASGCAGTVLGEDDFKAALKSIGARSSEDGKLLSAKQILSSICMTTANVKRIMQLFTVEDKKLEVAKYAYAHTLDQGNYFKLNDEFKNESSIDELNKAIVK